MSQDMIVAKRYAKALFDVANNRNLVQQIEEELRLVVESIASHADFSKLLKHPNVQKDVKLAMVRSVFEGKLTDLLLDTLYMLVERRREDILPALLDNYIRISNEATGQAHAIVTTPVPLTEEESATIADQFGKLTGKSIRVTNVVNPATLGGMEVRIGDRLYDGSLAGKLVRLQKTLSVS